MNFALGLGDLLTLSTAIVGVVAWFIRLEVKAEYNNDRIVKNEKEIEKLEVKLDALDGKIMEKLSMIERSLAKIEGRLSIENEKSE